MTAALIIENGTSNTVVPKEKYNTLKKADEHITALKSAAGSVKGPNKTKIISAFEGDYGNYARAVSAANGFLKAMDNGSKVIDRGILSMNMVFILFARLITFKSFKSKLS